MSYDNNDNVKLFASCKSEFMMKEIKILQSAVGLEPNGIATEGLVKLLPIIKGKEKNKGIVIVKRILMLKGFFNSNLSTDKVDIVFKNSLDAFKISVGISLEGNLVDKITWRKLLEY